MLIDVKTKTLDITNEKAVNEINQLLTKYRTLLLFESQQLPTDEKGNVINLDKLLEEAKPTLKPFKTTVGKIVNSEFSNLDVKGLLGKFK